MAQLIGLATLVLANDPALAARKKKPEVVAPAPVVPSIKAGVDLWRTGDYAGAVAMWQPFAQAGDKDALFNMGQAYKLGRAVPKDTVLARDYFRRAALLGHLPAQANLGIMLFQAGEKPEAVKWLKQAADKNEMRAQYVLGVALWNGDGVPRSLTLAYAYLARASALGMPEASTALNTLTGVIAPQERANGWAVATSIAAGNGVPPEFADGRPRVAVASADSFSRDQVIKPLPRPIVEPPKPAPAIAAKPLPTPAAAIASPPPAVATISAPAAASPTPVAVLPKPVAPPVAIAATPAPAPRPAVNAAPAPAPATMAPPVLTAKAPAPAIVKAPAPAAVKPQPAPEPRKPAPPVVVAQAAPVPVAKPLPPTPVERAAAPVVKTVDVPAAAPAVVAVAKPAPPVVAAAKPVELAAAAPKPVPPAAKKPAGWRVQLGAFSKKSQAEAAWADVKTKQKTLIADKKPIFEADGNVTKLQLGPYANKTAARDACAKIAFSGRACFVTEG